MTAVNTNVTEAGTAGQGRLSREEAAELFRRLKEAGFPIIGEWKTGENRFGEQTRWKEYRIA